MNCGKSLVTRARSASKEKTAFVFFVSSWQIVATLVVAMMLAGPVRAQLGPPKAEVAAIVDTTAAKPGTDVHAALQVHLPEGYHTNSNQPRDPNLIPISVTFDPPPPGITFIEVVFPPATDLAQRGADQPLRVFSGDFNIGVALKVAGSAAPGTVKLPATLRYQACDEVACYAPARISVTWDLNVANAAGQKQHADVFGTIKFGSGEPAKIAGLGQDAIKDLIGTWFDRDIDLLMKDRYVSVLNAYNGDTLATVRDEILHMLNQTNSTSWPVAIELPSFTKR